MVEGDVGSIGMRLGSQYDGNPLSNVQLAAPSIVLKIPSTVAAYRAGGEPESNASAFTVTGDAPTTPPLASDQFWPPSVLLNTPASVPANSVEGVEGSMARAETLTV